MSKRDEYVAKMKQQLDEWNAEIGELEAKAQGIQGDAREEYEEQINNLREKSKAVQDKLEDIKGAGEDAWEGLVADAERVWDALKHSLNYFKSQL